MKEADLVYEVRLNFNRASVRLFRNNVGALQDKAGNYVTYGLGKGTSDLIGWRSFVITPEDVGHTIAVFCAVECKSDRGSTSEEQLAFIQTVLTSGGIAGVVRSVAEARQLLGY